MTTDGSGSAGGRALPRAALTVAAVASVLFVVSLTGARWAVPAGWAVAVVAALVAAAACAGNLNRPAAQARVWRRLSGAAFLIALIAVLRFGEWLVSGPDRPDRVSGPHAAAHAALVVLLVLMLCRVPSSRRTRTERLELGLEAGAVMVVTAAYLWYFVVSHLLAGELRAGRLVVACAAVIVPAAIGVLLGVRTVLTGYDWPYRTMMLRLGAVVVFGGLATGPLQILNLYELDTGPLIIPLAALALTLGARRTGARPAPSGEHSDRWRRRGRFLPVAALAAADGLLLHALVTADVRDRFVVGAAALLLTAVAAVRQLATARQSGMLERRFRQLVQNSYDVVTISRADGTITYMSGGSQRMFGRTPDQRTGGNLFELVHPDDHDRVRALMAEVTAEIGGTRLWRSRFRHADGSWRRIEVLTTNLLHEPSVGGIVCNTRDVTEAHDLAERLRHDATHDALTGLANRSLFHSRLTTGLTRDGDLSVIIVDLDDFKVVNDTLGHAAGDELLVQMADRLRQTVRADDLVARLGGDEFAIMLPGDSAVEVETVLHRIVAGLRTPMHLEHTDHVVRASFGVVTGAAGDEAGDLMRRADIAMYEAKAGGGGGWQHFVPGMQARGLELDQTTADLRRALAAREFFLLYQPVVRLPDGSLAGAEALVRWQHPERGTVGPLDFIPAAERTEVILELGGWVLREACRQMAVWGAEAPETISVNVSARQLRDPAFAADVAAALTESALEPQRLIIEITESTAVGGGATAESLRQLRRLGVRLSLDDFGTGHSTLTLLATCPVDQIKLDRSFVDSDVVARAVLQLARGFGVEAVAEGIETEAQRENLQAMGYEHAQGYLFARPVPAAGLPGAVRHQVSKNFTPSIYC